MTSRENLLRLFFLAYVQLELGMLQTVIGITLTDLQCLFRSDLREVSCLFLAAGLSMMAACVLSMYLMRKLNLYLLLAVTNMLYGFSISIVAGTHFIQVGITAVALSGFLIGMACNAAYYLCNLLFPESGYALHVLTAAVSAGSVLCPVMSGPFLGKHQFAGGCNTSSYVNNTAAVFETIPHERLLLQSIHDNNQPRNTSYCETFKSSVGYLYVTLGTISVPAMLCFSIIYFKFDDAIHLKANDNTELAQNRSRFQTVFLVLLLASIPCPYGLAYAYGSYLVTIGVTGPLHIGVNRMTFLASVFWFTFLAGRMAAVAVSVCTRQVVILYICLIGQIASLVVILLTNGTMELFLWTGSLTMAFFTGPQFGALMTWSRYYVLWTPYVLGMIGLADCVGMAFLPYISGQVISSHGHESYICYCLGLAIVECILFCALHLIGRCMGEVTDTSPKQDVIQEKQQPSRNHRNGTPCDNTG